MALLYSIESYFVNPKITKCKLGLAKFRMKELKRINYSKLSTEIKELLT